MLVQNNSISIFNFKMKNFLIKLLIFSIPVIIIFIGVELLLRNLEYSVTIKKEFFDKNRKQIKILALGSSHYERGINPKYLNHLTLNLGNSAQRINENFELLKTFEPDLPSLRLVILELSYDWLERDKYLTSPIVDVLNLIFYDVNTFERNINIKDHSMFLSDSEYFSKRISLYFKNEKESTYNKFGFDTSKFYGSYEAVNHNDSLILDKDIFVENIENSKVFTQNLKVLNEFITYCSLNDLNIIIYNPPIHYRYNNLRKQTIVNRRDSLLLEISNTYNHIKIFNDESNLNFTAEYFYNGDHLNPLGAKKATSRLNVFIEENYTIE